MNLIDNPIIRGIGRIADFVILNLLWLICSLPVITIGASTTALYTVMLKLVKNEEGYIAKGFLKAFKDNFRQGTILWLLFMLSGSILIVDFSSLKFMPGNVAGIMQVLFLVMGCLLVGMAVYAFALQARFENTIKSTLKNALILVFAKLPYTLLIILFSIGPVIITILTPQTLMIGLLLWLFIGAALVAWLNSFLLRHVFVILEKMQPENADSEGFDTES